MQPLHSRSVGGSDDPAAQLNAYVVGGAVRDALLGLPAGDRDWVVVGATPEDMARRGFIPVGGDFPVFLHPVTKEEYALARTERKSGRGYKGFTFYTGVEVTLEDDLRRRDLTVNAIAQAGDGTLIDPLNGVQDLRDRVLRHTSAAFSEDPVRILRLARFAARLTDFQIAPATLALCRDMVHNGEVDTLVPERVWREVSRALMSAAPQRMFDVLDAVHALVRVMPGLQWHDAVRTLLVQAAQAGLPLPGRYGVLCLHTEARDALSAHLKVPTECADHARLLPLMCEPVSSSAQALALIERVDGLRRPERFVALLHSAAVCVALQVAPWKQRLAAVRSVDAGAIAKAAAPGEIKAAVRQARQAALETLCKSLAAEGS